MCEFDIDTALVTLIREVNETEHIVSILVNGELAAVSIVDNIEDNTLGWIVGNEIGA